jgi:hypothetical protein
MMNKEMQKALEADGEKLRQLTGEDHGPWIFCPECGGEGSYEKPEPLPDDPFRCKVFCCGKCYGTGYVEGFEEITQDEIEPSP